MPQNTAENESPPRSTPRRWGLRLLAVGSLTVVAAMLLFARPAIHQDLAYHHFADQRPLLGVPHFWNVVSNVPFLFVGLWGIATVLRTRTAFDTPAERWPYLCFFAGLSLTTFGSAYYHLAPDSGRLVWDRLPMGLAFMGLFDAMIAERIGLRVGRLLLVPLVVLGVGSVLHWAHADDLRLYYLVQFYPGLAIPLMLVLFPARYTGTEYLFIALALYVAAKLAEYPYDAAIYEALGQTLSGHTLKHLLAALSACCIGIMLRQRRKTS
jgi:hypothetical protein